MHSFKDAKGREWRLEANIGTYGRVRDMTGVKLYDIATENRESLVQLTDAYTLGMVLWALVEPQAEAAGVTPEGFSEAIDGTVLDAAYNALIREMVFFCPPRQRKVLTTAVERLAAAEQRAEKMMDEMLPQLEAEMDAAIDRLILGHSPGSSPESSESIPASGRSGSSSTLSAAASESSGITPVPS